jgi:hypothetical protein
VKLVWGNLVVRGAESPSRAFLETRVFPIVVIVKDSRSRIAFSDSGSGLVLGEFQGWNLIKV